MTNPMDLLYWLTLLQIMLSLPSAIVDAMYILHLIIEQQEGKKKPL